MSRYIDADKLYELIRTNDYKLATKNGSIDYGMFTVGIRQTIDKMPTANVVEVVRCKDCRHYKLFTGYNENFCNEYGGFVVENDFCSRAEKKGEQE